MKKVFSKIVKPIFDFLFSLVVLCLLSPFLLLVILILYFQNKGNPFFYQTRIGENNRSFQIVKFKTMKESRNSLGELLPDNQRITPFGKWLRNLSIDEIPQLLNVLRGEMSLMGPRPLLPEYLPLYNTRQILRHKVKPGITGWAQVHGRNAISWEKKFEYDVWYVENISFKVDWIIFVKTFKKILFKDGINASNEIPMEKFNGSTNS